MAVRLGTACTKQTRPARGRLRTELPEHTSSYVGFAVFPAVYPTASDTTVGMEGGNS